MDNDVKISRRGVYYDLTISPYEFKTPYGEIFKFSSKKKLDIYTRDIGKEIKRLMDILERNDLSTFLPDSTIDLLINAVYRSLYRRIQED